MELKIGIKKKEKRMDKNEFSARLLQLRREKGFSQKELGELLGVSNKAISKWENGEALPKTETMLRLADLLGIDGNALLGIELPAQDEDRQTDERLDRLEAENLALKNRIDLHENKKRKTAATVSLALLALAVVCILGALLFSHPDAVNNGRIEDAGLTGTKIEFSGETFYPCTQLQNGLLSFNQSSLAESFEQKSAKFYAADGSEQTVTVNAAAPWRLLLLRTRDGSYYYANDVSLLEMKPENLYGVFLTDKSISDLPYAQDPYYDPYLYQSFPTDEFCELYASANAPTDKKITELYLGTRGKTVSVCLQSIYLPDLKAGEFFMDNDGNLYFYRYADGKSYPVKKELQSYVCQ